MGLGRAPPAAGTRGLGKNGVVKRRVLRTGTLFLSGPQRAEQWAELLGPF